MAKKFRLAPCQPVPMTAQQGPCCAAVATVAPTGHDALHNGRAAFLFFWPEKLAGHGGWRSPNSSGGAAVGGGWSIAPRNRPLSRPPAPETPCIGGKVASTAMECVLGREMGLNGCSGQFADEQAATCCRQLPGERGS